MKQFRLLIFLSLFAILHLDAQGKSKIYPPLKNYEILQSYGAKNSSFGSWYHCADDLVGSGGTEVYAIADGNIVFSGPMKSNAWLIIIEHPELGVYSMYAHLSTRRDKLSIGKVKANERIAYIADDDEDGSDLDNGTGKNIYWGPHLHFGIRKGKKSDYHVGKTKAIWMIGYTPKHPSEYGWLDPKKFIDG